MDRTMLLQRGQMRRTVVVIFTFVLVVRRWHRNNSHRLSLRSYSTYEAHKEAAPIRNKNFHHFDDMTRIYAKDRATDSTSQTVQEVLHAAEAEAIEDHLEDDNTEASDAHGVIPGGQIIMYARVRNEEERMMSLIH